MSGPLYFLFPIFFSTILIYSEFLFFKEYKKVRSLTRQNQLKIVMIATGMGFIFGSMAFPLVFDIPIEPIGTNFVFLCLIMISYTIIKHKLMDVNIVIRKTLIYSFLIAIITLLYLISVLIAEKYFQARIGYKSLPITIVVAMIVALFFIPVKNKIQNLVDRVFFRKSQAQIAKENQMLREELRRSEKLKSVAQLAAGMAHEIKNPLTSIKTFTEYLPEKYKDSDFREKFCRIAGGEINRIDNIVRDLLDFAKPAPPSLKHLNINETLDKTLNLISANIIKKNISLKRNYQRQNLEVNADTTQLKQVFLNLFLNSIDAMMPGGILMVKTQKSGNDVSIIVSDNGCGISPKDLPHIFDPFYTKKETGVGLGLAVVHGIIKNHGGKITIDSALGEGTTVTISFKMV